MEVLNFLHPFKSEDMTNEERRAAPNLMLMCYAHHQVTNDVKKYTVKKMQKMKREHERRFSSPDRAILERLHDWTAADTPQGVENLGRANQELGWNHHDEELAEAEEAVEESDTVKQGTTMYVNA